MDRRRGANRNLLSATTVAALLLGACGDGDGGGSSPEAQPAPGASTFAEGDFEGIPLPGRSTPVSERVEEGGVVTQSFEVRNLPPEELLDFYVEALAEHDVLEEPEEIGVGTRRGRWDVDGRELTVVGQQAETLDDNPGAPEVLTQLSLSLRPSGG